jgi:gamma-glutamyltranspeptidase/glutathione hydrolase
MSHVLKSINQTLVFVCLLFAGPLVQGANAPIRASHGMVVSQNITASQVGAQVLRDGGTATDAAVATAFALAVTHPSAGNIGGGGFLVYRPQSGVPVAYDFREVAPAVSHPEMWLLDGEYSFAKHHMSHAAVGVPGTVAGLYLAWQEHGKLSWKRLLRPAIALARDGFEVTHGLAASLQRALPRMQKYPASLAAYSNNGTPYVAGDRLKQRDLAKSLARIAKSGPDGFYRGRTAELIVAEMQANGGLITLEDLANYKAVKREPVRGSYRGYEILSMPPPSSGGIALVEMLNILEGYDLRAQGAGAAATTHRLVEAMRRAFADRARHLGDPEFNADMPLARLTSKEYAAQLRETIDPDAASISSPDSFEWPVESIETTHLSVVDAQRNAVSLTYTLEWGYGSGIVVPGGGFLLNNEMGDFNPGPGITTATGMIGTAANLAEPGKRMLSSMSPTVVAKDGNLFMATGSPGGRTIINTVLQTVVNVVDHEMNAQAAVDAGRIHHQWLPDKVYYERFGLSPDTLTLLQALGHETEARDRQGSAQIIVVDPESGELAGGVDARVPDAGGAGY